MGEVLRFTLVMGALSSVFDLLTFAILIWGFDAGAATFRTAWFVESMATQILVVFVIRSFLPFWTSRPHPVLLASSLGALAVALVLALGPVQAFLGFAPLPLGLLAAIGGLTVVYLGLAEWLKRVAGRKDVLF
jgi:Mg2+-importing ATPase